MKIFLYFLAFFMCGHVAAQDIKLPFQQPEIFRAQYHEEKHLPSLQRPIQSDGDFLYIKNTGMAWLMETPFKMKTIITPDGLTRYIDGSKQPQSDAVKKSMHVILDNISSIFSGDTAELQKYFDINATVDDVTLTPKSDQMSRYLQAIKLSGTDMIDQVNIIFSPEKYTIIHYNNYQIGNHHITDGERVFFE